jgi:hypothetical protein
MSPENPTYTVLVARSSHTSFVTAKTSNGGDFRSRQPLLDGARYWIRKSADPAATIITAVSSGNGEWVLRATVGHAAKLTVRDKRNTDLPGIRTLASKLPQSGSLGVRYRRRPAHAF